MVKTRKQIKSILVIMLIISAGLTTLTALYTDSGFTSAIQISTINSESKLAKDYFKGPFEHETKYSYNFGHISQEGIASDDNGHFFISSALWPLCGEIVIAEINENTNKLVKTSINGIQKIEIGWHAGDPFCDDNYLFVPWINWNGLQAPTEAKCYVYYLTNLSELQGSPFDLKNNNKYIPGAASGAYYNGYYYISSYFPTTEDSKIYKFSFNPNSGFTYENWFNSLGKKEVQGIDFIDDKCFFVRGHGKDPYVYWINTSTWDEQNLGKQDLRTCSDNSNGPYEGITFDTSNGDIVAFFGFGTWTFESYQYTGCYKHPDLDCSGRWIGWEDVLPEAMIDASFTLWNTGDSGSFLNWEITEWPNWGLWFFDPINGSNLTPEKGKVVVDVLVIAPHEKSHSYNGKIKIVNLDDENDFFTINVCLKTPKEKNSRFSVLLFEHFKMKNVFDILLRFCRIQGSYNP